MEAIAPGAMECWNDYAAEVARLKDMTDSRCFCIQTTLFPIIHGYDAGYYERVKQLVAMCESIPDKCPFVLYYEYWDQEQDRLVLARITNCKTTDYPHLLNEVFE